MHAHTPSNRGFTLIEMMITITVAAMLLMIAVPSFRNASLSSQLRSAASDFIASSNLARSEAIKRGSPVTLCVSADGSTCAAGGWEQGWIVLSGTTVLQHEYAAPSGFKLSATGNVATLSFQPIGVGATPATRRSPSPLISMASASALALPSDPAQGIPFGPGNLIVRRRRGIPR